MRDGRGRILSESNQLKKRFYLHSELAEDEPLRTIMAEIQQNQHLTTGAGVGPRSAAAGRTVAGSTGAHASTTSSGQDTGAAAQSTVKAPVTEGMSDRIEQLKRKASESKQQQQQK